MYTSNSGFGAPRSGGYGGSQVKSSSGIRPPSNISSHSPISLVSPSAAPTKEEPIKIAYVTYDYQPQDGTQIALRKGDQVKVFDSDDSGWWFGLNARTGERGIFPSTYTEELADEEGGIGSIKSKGNENQVKLTVNTSSIRPELQDKKKIGSAEKQNVLTRTLKSEHSGSLHTTKFGVYASNMCRLNGFATALVCIGGMVIQEQLKIEGNNINMLDLGDTAPSIFMIGTIFGIFSIFFENFFDGRSGNKIPLRSALYLGGGTLLCFTNYTLFNGLIYLIAAVFHLIGTCRGELGTPRLNLEASKKSESTWRPSSPFCFPCEFVYRRWKQGKVGKDVFTILSICVNIALFFAGHESTVAAMKPGGPLARYQFTQFVPWAKSFGYTLNLLCAVIVLPVCRTFIRKLADMSTQNQSTTSTFLRSILWLFPLDNALHFHEKCGWVLLFSAFGHSFCHLLNASLRWPQVLDRFGWPPLLTGFLLWLCIFFMFPAVHPSVKRGQFEIFWYSHQLFFAFFLLNLVHGTNWLGPNYWKAFIVPGILYFLERIYREYSCYKLVSVLSVTNMNGKVLSLEIDSNAFPGGYLEGQYCFVMVPYVSKTQWHPFSISSAPGDPTITLHIKIQGNGSWTGKVMEYFSIMGPKGSSYFELQDSGPRGIVQGKSIGIMGEKLLLVYGPHSAPTQHVPEYSVDIIIGSGIGVTPVSSCMQQTVFHRWRYDIGATNPSHAYFVWMCAYKELQYFRWMVRVVKDCHDEVNQMRAKAGSSMNNKTFEVHIFITSIPDNADREEAKVDDEIGFWGRRAKHEGNIVERAPEVCTELDIYNVMVNPPKGAPAQLGDITIYRGRPNWDSLFGKVANRHPVGKHGVAFCGNAFIGSDLRAACEKHSNPANNMFFSLHKENF